jgi:hypothetical protein
MSVDAIFDQLSDGFQRALLRKGDYVDGVPVVADSQSPPS